MLFPLSLARPLLLAALLGLGGCAAVVPQTAARLQALNPLTLDPSAVTVALILPAGMQIEPGTAVLILVAQRGDHKATETFVLAPREAAAVVAPAGAIVAGFGVTAADAERMRLWQGRISDWKAKGAASGSISVGVGGCKLGDGPAPDATGAVLIRLSEEAAFQPLIRPTRLSALLGKTALAEMQPCDAAQ